MTDWAEIYRATFPDLVRYLHRKVWDEERARDLAQEAFARALQSCAAGAAGAAELADAAGTADPGGAAVSGAGAGRAGATGAVPDNPRAWVFRIAANLAYDEARSAVRRRRHLTLLQAESADAATEDPVAALDRAAQQRAARAALEQLSERDREALLLWDAGLSYTEIAAQTGLAVGAIGTTLARARRRLVAAHAELEARHAAHG
jgi:DNA-directed RNA polymerase specialized sigma24 family protein